MADWIDDLSQVRIDPDILRRVPPELARDDLILPLRMDGDVLVVAVASPPDPEDEDRFRFVTNCELRCVEAPLMSLKVAIWRYYGMASES